MAIKQKTEDNMAAAGNAMIGASGIPGITTASINSNLVNDIKQEKLFDGLQDTKENMKDIASSESNKAKKEDGTKDPAKPQDKSRPISSTPVPGTPW